jgi:tRNA dimethylallyltransferase
MPIRLLVIAGPNASGKTRLGVEVAHGLGSEIISADSRQTYRGLDIGSGKDLDEYRVVTPPVPYHLIDVADPREVYSVFHYQRDCYRLLEEKEHEPSFGRGLPLLMVGGTGLFIEAVLRGYRIPNVPEDEALRRRLMRRRHADLVEELRSLDDELLRRTDCSSKKRVVRALEIADYARHHPVRYSPPPPVPIDYAVFAIDIPPEELRRRIDLRLETRLDQGMIAEVEGLLAAGIPEARLAQLGLEYREVSAYLNGTKTRQEMVDDLRRGIRKLAKRQRTWFRGLARRGIEVAWISPEDRDALLRHPWVAGASSPS